MNDRQLNTARFGTFAGVFAPNVLTILGIILFLETDLTFLGVPIPETEAFDSAIRFLEDLLQSLSPCRFTPHGCDEFTIKKGHHQITIFYLRAEFLYNDVVVFGHIHVDDFIQGRVCELNPVDLQAAAESIPVLQDEPAVFMGQLL